MHTEAAESGQSAPRTAVSVVARTLLGTVDELAERARAETERSDAAYHEIVTEDDLRLACRRTITLLLKLLAGIDDPGFAYTLEEIGRRRARQGVGLDAMLRAFRIDFHIVGESLFAWLHSRPTSSMQEWNDFVLPLWKAIDTISVEVSRAYRDAEAEMEGELEKELRVLFDELMYGTGPVNPAALRTASRFGLTEFGRFVAVRADSDGRTRPPDRAVRETGAHSVWIQDASMLTGIVVLRSTACSQLEEILPRTLPGRVGISPPYRALADTRRQAWLADAARDSAPPGEQCVVCAADDIAAVFIGGALSGSQYLAETIAEALGHAREPERARLLETVRAHLDGDGSPTTTARTLYRHRNTVLNHLRRFEELTGLDLSRPADTATAVLALRAVNRFGREG